MKPRPGLRSIGIYILESSDTQRKLDSIAIPVKNDTQEVHYDQMKT